MSQNWSNNYGGRQQQQPNQQGYYDNNRGYPAQQQQQHQQQQQQQNPQGYYNQNQGHNPYQWRAGQPTQRQQQYQQPRQVQQHQQHQPHYGHQGGQYQPQQHHQQQQQYHQNPFAFNVNAQTFVPRNQGIQGDQYPPAYCNAPMYGIDSYHAPYMYQNHQASYANPHPTMTHFYSENEDEQAQYDAMYAQFGQPQEQCFMPNEQLYNRMLKSDSNAMLQEVLVGLEQLVAESDEEGVATWSAAIRQRLENMDEDARQIALSILVEMAALLAPNELRGGNPQYTLACVMHNLSNEIANLTTSAILPVLKTFHDGRRSYDNEQRVNLVLFYTEIYDKLVFDNGSRIAKLGEAVCDQIDDVLQFQPDDVCMKYIIRIMKQAGAPLDATEALRSRVDSILTRMSGFANGSQRLSESIKTQILALIDLRQRGWGRSASSANLNRATSSSSAAAGAIIGADGLALDLSEEERTFLESQFGQLEAPEDVDSSQDIDENDMMKEFGKFVKEEVERDEEVKNADLMSRLQLCDDEPTAPSESVPAEPTASATETASEDKKE